MITVNQQLSPTQQTKLDDIHLATGFDKDMILSAIFEFGLGRTYGVLNCDISRVKKMITYHDLMSRAAIEKGVLNEN